MSNQTTNHERGDPSTPTEQPNPQDHAGVLTSRASVCCAARRFVDGLVDKAGPVALSTTKLLVYRDHNTPFYGWYGLLDQGDQTIASNAIAVEKDHMTPEEADTVLDEIKSIFDTLVHSSVMV